jgi:hypothetical protein
MDVIPHFDEWLRIMVTLGFIAAMEVVAVLAVLFVYLLRRL